MKNVSEMLAGLDLDAAGEGSSWRPHPAFAGVHLRDFLPAGRSGGVVSSLMVRIEPGCGLDEHVHPGSGEVHHVLAGEGFAAIGGERLEYRPGRAAFVPAGSEHAVRAGERGLLMLAVFCPALG